jgi:hypothetical protein
MASYAARAIESTSRRAAEFTHQKFSGGARPHGREVTAARSAQPFGLDPTRPPRQVAPIEVRRAAPGAHGAESFAERYIQHPVRAVLNLPISAHRTRRALHILLQVGSAGNVTANHSSR